MQEKNLQSSNYVQKYIHFNFTISLKLHFRERGPSRNHVFLLNSALSLGAVVLAMARELKTKSKIFFSFLRGMRKKSARISSTFCNNVWEKRELKPEEREECSS